MEINNEYEKMSKDISKEFLSMESFDFKDFLKQSKKEPVLSITIDWVDVQTARRLKAFLEDPSSLGKQKRFATIRVTEAQYRQEINVFESGIRWEKI